jgi:hypothetical protein
MHAEGSTKRARWRAISFAGAACEPLKEGIISLANP